MDTDIDSLALSVRADTDAFVRDVGVMRAAMRDDLAGQAQLTGRGIEAALRQAARNGKLEFEDLGRVAGRALGEIAAAALRFEGGGLGGLLGGAASGLLGLPGRATGGPVGPGRAYVVGERGPELFVPTSSGRVEAGNSPSGAVRVTVNMAAPSGDVAFMARSGRQIARGVRRALERAGG
ncbi:MAG: tail tape measure protein [Sandaracinobacter sp.]